MKGMNHYPNTQYEVVRLLSFAASHKLSLELAYPEGGGFTIGCVQLPIFKWTFYADNVYELDATDFSSILLSLMAAQIDRDRSATC